MDAVSIRASRDEDASLFACLREPLAAGDVRVVAVDGNGAACALGRMIPAGCTTQPGVPRLEVDWPAPADDQAGIAPPRDVHASAAPAISGTAPAKAMIESVLEVLLPTLLGALPGGAESTASIGWCPLEPVGLKRLRAADFRPAGGGAYRETSPGVIRWVDGYQDPTGSTIDLIR